MFLSLFTCKTTCAKVVNNDSLIVDAIRLEQIADSCVESCDYYSATIAYTKAAEIRKNIRGVNDLDYVSCLWHLAHCLSINGEETKAIPVCLEGLEVLRELKRKDDIFYGLFLELIALTNSNLGNYTEAIKHISEALNIYKKTLGEGDISYFYALKSLSTYNYYNGNYTEAVKYGAEVLEKFDKSFFEKDSDYVSFLGNLAECQIELGNYTEAIRLNTETLEIIKRVYGKNHLEYAYSLSNLALCQKELGNYTEAIKGGREALVITKDVVGENHPTYINILEGLASCEYSLGNYTESLKLETTALGIIKNIYGEDDLKYAKSLNGLAIYNSILGNHRESVELRKKALTIVKSIYGENHLEYASCLSSLAVGEGYLGNYSEAIKLGKEALSLIKKYGGTDNLKYVESLHNLATFYSKIGDYSESIKLEEEVLNLCKLIKGNNDYTTAALHNLSVLNSLMENYDKAIELETEAMETNKKLYGAMHPNYSFCKEKISDYNFALGNYEQAIDYILSVAEIRTKNLVNSFSKLSPQRRKHLWDQQSSFFLCKLPFYVYMFPTPDMISMLYNKTALLSKGILLNTEIEMIKLIEESGDDELMSIFQNLLSNYEIFDKQSNLPILERCVDIDSIQTVIQNQEDLVVLRSQKYGNYMHNLNITWKDIQHKLRDEDVVIEFLDFPVGDSIVYIALTLKKEYDIPRLIPIFELNQLKGISENEYFYTSHLSNLVWGPLEEELNGVKNVYFSPSGELHRIGIEYLQTKEGIPFCEKYNSFRLSSTRQIVKRKELSTQKFATVYGGVDYDTSNNTLIDNNYRSVDICQIQIDSIPVRGAKHYLEGTKIEADSIYTNLIQHNWNCTYYVGSKGTERSFKMMNRKSPSILHVATHGFYMTNYEKRGKNTLSELKNDLYSELEITEDKPMTRSGLLLSGCNHALNHEVIPQNEEDGILTAQEISLLDLRGLDLVALSACETGLGDIASGEGVFGLQRGFKKAGANTIIMSLWKVSDIATVTLMTTFYKYLLNGMSKHGAFSKAREDLRKMCSPEQYKPDWAAFIILDGLN